MFLHALKMKMKAMSVANSSSVNLWVFKKIVAEYLDKYVK